MILLDIDKNLEVDLYSTVLLFNLTISLQIKGG